MMNQTTMIVLRTNPKRAMTMERAKTMAMMARTTYRIIIMLNEIAFG